MMRNGTFRAPGTQVNAPTSAGVQLRMLMFPCPPAGTRTDPCLVNASVVPPALVLVFTPTRASTIREREVLVDVEKAETGSGTVAETVTQVAVSIGDDAVISRRRSGSAADHGTVSKDIVGHMVHLGGSALLARGAFDVDKVFADAFNIDRAAVLGQTPRPEADDMSGLAAARHQRLIEWCMPRSASGDDGIHGAWPER